MMNISKISKIFEGYYKEISVSTLSKIVNAPQIDIQLDIEAAQSLYDIHDIRFGIIDSDCQDIFIALGIEIVALAVMDGHEAIVQLFSTNSRVYVKDITEFVSYVAMIIELEEMVNFLT